MRHNSTVVKNILSLLQEKGCLKEPLQSFSDSSDSWDSDSPDRSGSNSPERKVIVKSRSSTHSPASHKSSVPPKGSPRYRSRSKSPVPTVSKTYDPSRPPSTDRSVSPASHPSPSKAKRSARSASSSTSSDSDSYTDYKRRKKRVVSGSHGSSSSKILRKREHSRLTSSPGSESKKKRTKSTISEPMSDLSAVAPACASGSLATRNPAHNITAVTFTLNMRTDVKHQVALLMADMRRQSLTFNANSDPILAKLQTNSNVSICSFYQVGLCTKVSHKSAFNTVPNLTYLHICAFCISKLKIALGHDFRMCPYVIFKKTD